MESEEFFLATCLFGVICATILILAACFDGCGRDDSDPPGGHSYMQPLVDFKTGCQYLRASGGGLTPRLAPDGKQICGH